MATKSTKFSYTNLAKVVCLLLSALLFTLGTFCAVKFGQGTYIYGQNAYWNSEAAAGKQSYTETRIFRTLLEEDVFSLGTLSSKNIAAYKEALADAQEETVEEIVEQYIARYKYLIMQDMDPEDESFMRNPQVEINLDNDYYSEYVEFYYKDMSLSEDEIRDELNRQYDDWEASQLEEYQEDADEAVTWISYHDESFKYYVRSVGGTVYTNLFDKPSLAEVKSHKVYAAETKKVNELGGLPSLDGLVDDESSLLFDDTKNGAIVYFYLDDDVVGTTALPSATYAGQDEYIASRKLYDSLQKYSAKATLTVMIIAYLLGLALLLWFLHLVGHVNVGSSDANVAEPARYGKDGSLLTYAGIDRFPGDIHFLITAVLLAVAIGVPLAMIADQSGDVCDWYYYPWVGMLAAFIGILLIGEWLASVCRSVKSGYGFWKNTSIVRFARWLWKKSKVFVAYCKKTWHLTTYAPKYLHKHAFGMTAGYVAINLVLVALTRVGGLFGFLMAIALIAFNVYVLNKLLHYLKGLDEIIAASEPGADTTVEETGLPISLQTLADNMAVSRDRIDRAVEKAVKEEQTRTELITNVTHDLKTPLTSLINYSDLLTRKANDGTLGDEESEKYAGVIHDQSEKLKHLIEDLLEASKASAGNVQLNCTTLNLTELAAQAIAEFAPEMEKNQNEVVFVDGNGEPAAAEHRIYADGTETYRILSNLLSNAQKYSAPGTRIYATVKDGPVDASGAATTQFELKNISAAALNISAEELMERFVRGDRSRGETDGNGLGLSIARDLATLMGGSLKLEIDGDMFKATLTLPKTGE